MHVLALLIALQHTPASSPDASPASPTSTPTAEGASADVAEQPADVPAAGAQVDDDWGADHASTAAPAAPTNDIMKSTKDALRDPVLRERLVWGGAITAGVGGLSIVGGLVPWAMYGASDARLSSLRGAYVDAPDRAVVVEASAVQADATTWRDAWNNGGLWAVWGGIALALVGGAVAVAPTLVDSEAPVTGATR